MYLYISEAKVQQLANELAVFPADLKGKLSFNIGVLQGAIEGKVREGLHSDLERVIKELRRHEEIISFDEVLNKAPILVSFKGGARRLVQDGAFWMAVRGARNVLLLVGSAGYALGRPIAPSVTISPSVDPVNAIREAFEAGSKPAAEGMEASQLSLSSRLSYAWQAVYGASGPEEGVLPNVEGIALFAHSVRADKDAIQAIGRETLESLIIGTPIYVKQVQE
jgi:hypothetical protein